MACRKEQSNATLNNEHLTSFYVCIISICTEIKMSTETWNGIETVSGMESVM